MVDSHLAIVYMTNQNYSRKLVTNTHPRSHTAAQPFAHRNPCSSCHEKSKKIRIHIGNRCWVLYQPWMPFHITFHIYYSLPCCLAHVSRSSRCIIVCFSPSRNAASALSNPRRTISSRPVILSETCASERSSAEGMEVS